MATLRNTTPIKNRIMNGQATMVDTNFGKQINVRLLGGEIETLYIKGGAQVAGAFRYICHKALNPRKEFITMEIDTICHANIYAGYYYIDPVNIVL